MLLRLLDVFAADIRCMLERLGHLDGLYQETSPKEGNVP
jgi:hypothetical protein